MVVNGSSWHWRKGTSEVSSPNTLWRGVGFDDSTWAVGSAPFHYGEGLSGGTLLSDMRYNYTCVFLRVSFVITNVTEISQVQLVANDDDGFVAWINGTEVARARVANTNPAYTDVASGLHKADPARSWNIE